MLLRRARDFRLIWTGQVVSVVGDGVQRVALLWWARRAGGNGLLAAVALAAMLPVIVGSPFGGWLADRYDRRRSMIVADVLRLFVTGGMATLVLAGHDRAPIILAGVVLVGCGTALFDPAYAAAVPTLVDEDDLPAANGLNLANGAVGGLIGPLIGGMLIAVLGIGTVLIVNAATFGWSALWIARATVRRPLSRSTSAAMDDGTHSTAHTLRFVAGHRTLRRLLGLAMVLNMAVAPMSVLIVSLVTDRFHRGPMAYGLLDVMISAGVLIGSVTVRRLSGVTLAAAVLALGLCLASAGFLPIAGVAAAFLVGGVAVAVANTVLLTSFQSAVPEDMHGRLFGAVGAAGVALRPIGLALAAPLVAAAGVTGGFVVVGIGLALPALLWAGPLFARPFAATPDIFQGVDDGVDTRVA